jgi:hypothetical protein
MFLKKISISIKRSCIRSANYDFQIWSKMAQHVCKYREKCDEANTRAVPRIKANTHTHIALTHTIHRLPTGILVSCQSEVSGSTLHSYRVLCGCVWELINKTKSETAAAAAAATRATLAASCQHARVRGRTQLARAHNLAKRLAARVVLVKGDHLTNVDRVRQRRVRQLEQLARALPRGRRLHLSAVCTRFFLKAIFFCERDFCECEICCVRDFFVEIFCECRCSDCWWESKQ